MLRNKPKLSYCGLTIILSNPSRFDTISLLSSTGGFLLNDCFDSQYSRLHCDIRLKEDTSSLLPQTKAVLLLGESALHNHIRTTINNTIHEMRGSYFEKGAFGLPTIATYLPQDAADFKNYEAQFNPEAEDYSEDGEYIDEDDEDEDLKGMGRTKRANYAFWIKSDCSKVMDILRENIPKKIAPKLILEPKEKDAIECLNDNKDKELLFDMETDYEDQNMLCFSFSFDGGYTVFCVPIIDYNYRLYYNCTGRIMASLQEAIRTNTIIAHNGANFDFLVLAMKYRIAVRNAYDTMIAQHRIYPAVEKSLGHAVSLWTWEKFHKDMDSKSYRTYEDMVKKLTYCGHDVFTMGLVKKSQDKFAATIPGLQDSIRVANESIRPYLTCMMQGIRYNEDEVKKVIFENDRLMEQYNRIIGVLLGPVGLSEVKRALKGPSKGMFAGSNKQCAEYFHNILGYSIQGKSEKTGAPTLGKKSLFKLALKYDNPVIRFVILYRILKKETSALQFNPWKDNNNKILPRVKYES